MFEVVTLMGILCTEVGRVTRVSGNSFHASRGLVVMLNVALRVTVSS